MSVPPVGPRQQMGLGVEQERSHLAPEKEPPPPMHANTHTVGVWVEA